MHIDGIIIKIISNEIPRWLSCTMNRCDIGPFRSDSIQRISHRFICNVWNLTNVFDTNKIINCNSYVISNLRSVHFRQFDNSRFRCVWIRFRQNSDLSFRPLFFAKLAINVQITRNKFFPQKIISFWIRPFYGRRFSPEQHSSVIRMFILTLSSIKQTAAATTLIFYSLNYSSLLPPST